MKKKQIRNLKRLKEKAKETHEKSCNNNEIMNPIYHFHLKFLQLVIITVASFYCINKNKFIF